MFERGNINEYFDYTEISLLNPCCNVCANMLGNRANEAAEAVPMEEQNDFRRDRSCIDSAK
jgi:hypothetical protein